MTTEDYEELHVLTEAQLAALDVLCSGGTHDEAAAAARVHRVTVSNWNRQHPAFIAERNRRKVELREAAVDRVERLRRSAIAVVGRDVEAGSVATSLRVLGRIGFTSKETESLPVTAEEVIEQEARRHTPGPFDDLDATLTGAEDARAWARSDYLDRAIRLLREHGREDEASTARAET